MKQTIEAKGWDTVGCAKKDSATTPQGHRGSPAGAEADSPGQRPGIPPPENTALKGRKGTPLTHAISVTGQVPPLQGGIRRGGPPRAGALGFQLAPLRGSSPISSRLSLTLTTLACTHFFGRLTTARQQYASAATRCSARPPSSSHPPGAHRRRESAPGSRRACPGSCLWPSTAQ